MSAMGWIKEHPYETGGIVFVGGVVVLYFLGFFSGTGASSSGGDTSGAAAYYAAESAQAQAGDALQAVQIQSQAQTAQTQIAADASTMNNSTWANAQTTQAGYSVISNEDNDETSVQNNLISTLGSVASLPGTQTNTYTPTAGGYFLINPINVPNQSAQTAAGLLAELESTGFNPSNG